MDNFSGNGISILSAPRKFASAPIITSSHNCRKMKCFNCNKYHHMRACPDRGCRLCDTFTHNGRDCKNLHKHAQSLRGGKEADNAFKFDDFDNVLPAPNDIIIDSGANGHFIHKDAYFDSIISQQKDSTVSVANGDNIPTSFCTSV